MGHNQTELIVAKQNIEKYTNPIFWYFISLYLFAWVSAILLRYLVIAQKLDSLFLINNEWYYAFNGYGHPEAENIIATVISVIVEIGSTNYLYMGFLERYKFTNQGELQNITLKGAYRRNLDFDKPPNSTQKEKDNFKERFYKVDGDYLVIEYSQIKTLNISYLKVEPLKNGNFESSKMQTS